MKKYLILEIEDEDHLVFQSINEVSTMDLAILTPMFNELVKRDGDYTDAYDYFVSNLGMNEDCWKAFDNLIPLAVFEPRCINSIKILDVAGEREIYE